ncbi:cupin domain-containing protein [Mitsuaria sp. GD03876]|uniref:cupin domain-containing protein n=1 Tax=Mitsuaria sp. GD03876 TaxID=2975399 RepID=UPI0024488043|nr:cupin domain-containing protein [Mitsuaria sp. GD03876]MDH0866808.1 cupin domain-containing protein [Mitsuaria sp. GD03876]
MTTPSQPATPRDYRAINLADKLSLLHEHWSQRVVAEMNDYQFKIAKVEGEFLWHAHADTDETFLVVAGELRLDFRDGAVTLRAGEMFVVPKGVEHKPSAAREAHLLVIEPRGVVNTGAEHNERTRPNDQWV